MFGDMVRDRCPWPRAEARLVVSEASRRAGLSSRLLRISFLRSAFIMRVIGAFKPDQSGLKEASTCTPDGM
jgi:hypothetical protein